MALQRLKSINLFYKMQVRIKLIILWFLMKCKLKYFKGYKLLRDKLEKRRFYIAFKSYRFVKV